MSKYSNEYSKLGNLVTYSGSPQCTSYPNDRTSFDRQMLKQFPVNKSSCTKENYSVNHGVVGCSQNTLRSGHSGGFLSGCGTCFSTAWPGPAIGEPKNPLKTCCRHY